MESHHAVYAIYTAKLGLDVVDNERYASYHFWRIPSHLVKGKYVNEMCV